MKMAVSLKMTIAVAHNGFVWKTLFGEQLKTQTLDITVVIEHITVNGIPYTGNVVLAADQFQVGDIIVISHDSPRWRQSELWSIMTTS